MKKDRQSLLQKRGPGPEGVASKRLSLARRLGLCALIALPVLGLHNRSVLRQFESLLYDMRVRMVADEEPVHPELVVLALDTDSLVRMAERLGRWPWARGVFAGVVDYCSEASVVAMDILFTQRDWEMPASDDLFAETVRDQERVVSAVFFNRGRGISTWPEGLDRFVLNPSISGRQQLIDYEHAEIPYAELLSASAGAGHVNYLADEDGVVRRYLVALSSQGRVMPSLALEMARMHLNLKPEDISVEKGRLILGDRTVPLDGQGRIRLRYSSLPYRVTTYPVADLLDSVREEISGREPKIPRDAFRGKIVLVGSTAIGLTEDRKVTPVGRMVPGVIINATAADNLLNASVWRVTAPWLRVMGVLVAVFLPAVLPVQRPITFGLWLLGAVAGYLLLVLGVTAEFRYMLPVTGPVLGLGVSLVTLGSCSWYAEVVRRRRLEQLEEAKQRFTDMLVHDLKGRTSAIMMSLSLLERKLADGDEQGARLISIARTSGSRLLDQIHALLDIRKIQEGQMPLQLFPMNPEDQLAVCVEEYQGAADLVDVGLVLDEWSGEPVQMPVDVEIFSRVLANLVWNALQYASSKSDIRVGLEGIEDGVVSIYVANEGRVIPEEDQEAIFAAFVSGSLADKEIKVPSSGLGLAFCRMACEAHGGTIHIQSPWKDGSGVKVVVQLPAR